MATRLKDTDVADHRPRRGGRRRRAAVGAGRARGHGLEAGVAHAATSRPTARNNYRGWPQSSRRRSEIRPRFAGVVAHRTARQHPPDAERRRRAAAISITRLAIEPVGFRRRETTRAKAPRIEGIDRRGWPVRLRRVSSPTTIRSSKSACRSAGNINGPSIRRGGVEGAAQAATDAAFAGTAFIERWRLPRRISAGIRFRDRPPSTRAPIRADRAACITGSATAAAVTWMRRTRRR